MILSLVVAMAENRVIGRDNTLPWHLPDDLKFFKAVTLDKPVVMGRRTFESIGRPLPRRTNIVLTGRRDYQAEGCRVVHCLEEALAAADKAPEVAIIGGASLYQQALPRAGRLYLTLVRAEIEGDTRFPGFDWEDWRVVERRDHQADERHAYPFSLFTLERTG